MEGDQMYMVERTEWDERWEQRDICCVCNSIEDARRYCEENAGNAYPMRWTGEMRYSGRIMEDGCSEEGLMYEICRVNVFR